MAWEKLGTASIGSGSVESTSWKELDRVTLSSAGNDLDTSTFSTKDNIMILANPIWNSGNPSPDFRFNGDSGSNYARRISEGGASDATATSQAEIYTDTWGGGAASGMHSFEVMELSNIAAQEKLIIHDKVYNRAGTGAGNAPNRIEAVHKWANTSAQVNRVQLLSSVSNAFASGSEVVVLGYDNDEADSGTNFWEELASVTLTSSGDLLNSGTITSKKYLMVESFMVNTGGSISSEIGFNSDTAEGNYANRRNYNGGNENTYAGSGNPMDDRMYSGYGDENSIRTMNMMIVNISDKEKLVIGHGMTNGAGEGTSNIPPRWEFAGKWTNTSSQISSVQIGNNGAGSYNTGSYIKVYGAD